jgi:hypothetical protein
MLLDFFKKSCIATRTIKKEANEGVFSQALQVARMRRSAITAILLCISVIHVNPAVPPLFKRRQLRKVFY